MSKTNKISLTLIGDHDHTPLIHQAQKLGFEVKMHAKRGPSRKKAASENETQTESN